VIPVEMFTDATWFFDQPQRFVGLMLVVWALGRWRADRSARKRAQLVRPAATARDVTPRRSDGARPLIEVVDTTQCSH
jgi:hypothetical protein